MDAGTFTNPTVATYLTKYFISVKVNGDDQSLGRYVKQTYNVRGYPTVLVLDGAGRLKGQLVGYRDASQFATDLSALVSGR